MEFEIGKQATLGGEVYEIKKLLGGGAVAVAYLATPASAPNSEVVIKTLRDDGDSGAADKQKALEGMRNEIKVLQALNAAEDPAWSDCQYLQARLERAINMQLKRRVVALLDSGEIDEGQPFQIQEKAPPAIELADFKIIGIADEFRLFKVVNAVLEAITLAHRSGFALRDFEPNTKWDRLRLKWLNAEQTDFELKIIDWNITGAKEDFARDLLYFGGHLFRLLFKRDIMFEKREDEDLPPRDLAAMTHEWNDVTEGTRQILQRLLNRTPERRYLLAEHLQEDCRQWSETLKDALSQDAFHLLQDRLWDLKRDDNFSGIFAVADLAQRALSTDEEKNAFRAGREQAREELEKREFLPIALARGSLLIGAYEKAALEFEKELANLLPDSETARQAEIYAALARAGAEMKKAKGGADIRETTEWLTLERGAQELIHRNVERALLEFTATLKAFPQSTGWLGFRTLQGKAMALSLYKQISEDLANLPPNPENPVSDEWLDGESGQIGAVESFIERFKAALNHDPKNVEIEARRQDEQERLKSRRGRLSQYRQIDDEINHGFEAQKDARTQISVEQISSRNSLEELNFALSHSSRANEHFQNAAKICADILRVESNQTRAVNKLRETKLWLAEEEKYRNAASKRESYLKDKAEAEASSQTYFNVGEYEKAYEILMEFTRKHGSLPTEWTDFSSAVNLAAAIQNDLQTKCRIAREDYLPALRGEKVEKLLSIFSTYEKKDLGKLPDGGDLSNEYRKLPFMVSPDISEFIPEIKRVLHDIKEAETAKDEGDRLRALQNAKKSLARLEIKLHPDFETELDRLQSTSDKRKEADAQLEAAKTFDALATLQHSIGQSAGVATSEIKNNLAERWRALLDGLADLAEFQIQTRRGVELFPERADFKIDLNAATTLIDAQGNLLNDADLWKDYPRLLEQMKDYRSKITDINQSSAASSLKTSAQFFWNAVVAKYESQIEINFRYFSDQANQFGGRKKIQSQFSELFSHLQEEILSQGLQERLQDPKQKQNDYLNIVRNLDTCLESFHARLNELGILSADHDSFFNAYETLLIYRFGSGDTSKDEWFQEQLTTWQNVATSTLKDATANLTDETALQRALNFLENFEAILTKLRQMESRYQAQFSNEILKSARQWLELKPDLENLNKLRQKPAESLSLSVAGTDIKEIYAALTATTDLAGNVGITAEYSKLCTENLLPLQTLLAETNPLIKDGDFQKSLTKLESGQTYADTLKTSIVSRWLLEIYQDYLRGEYESTLKQCVNGLQAQARKYFEDDLNTAAEKIRKEMILPYGREAGQSDARVRTRSAIEKAVAEVNGKIKDKGNATRVWQALADAIMENDAQEWKTLRQTALAQITLPVSRWRWGLALAGITVVFVAAVMVFKTWSNANMRTVSATANAQFVQTVAAQQVAVLQSQTAQATAQQVATRQAQTAQATEQTTQVAAQICAKTISSSNYPILAPPQGSKIAVSPAEKQKTEFTATWVDIPANCEWDASQFELFHNGAKAEGTYLIIIWKDPRQSNTVATKINFENGKKITQLKDGIETSVTGPILIPSGQITITIVLPRKSFINDPLNVGIIIGSWDIKVGDLKLYELFFDQKKKWINVIPDAAQDVIATYPPTPTMTFTPTATITVTPLPTFTLTPTPLVEISIP